MLKLKNHILEALSNWHQQYAKDSASWVIAYSGGVDSHVLLHAAQAYLNTIHSTIQLRAAHINHQLSEQAASWAEHCAQTCQSMAMACDSLVVKNKPQSGQSIEAFARDERYKLLSAHLTPQDILLTGHTHDDQAETVLLQLMRGSGPKGLSGMGVTKPLVESTLHRPFLSVSRQDIVAYAKDHALSWVEDPSNIQTHFYRNFIRHDILPKLQSKLPGIKQTFVRAAHVAQEAQSLLEELAKIDAEKAICDKTNRLDQSQVNHLSPERQKNLIRFWLGASGIKMPPAGRLNMIIEQFKAKEDTQPLIAWSDVQLRRYKNKWSILQNECFESTQSYSVSWLNQTNIILPNGQTLFFEKVKGQGISLANVDEIMICPRRCTGPLRPKGSQVSKPMKKWWQQFEIPAWDRALWPFVYLNGVLVEVPGLFQLETLREAKPAEFGLLIHYKTK